MPTRKLSDIVTIPLARNPCRHTEHDPPKHQLFEDGIYEHECPGCHWKQVFTVTRPTL